MSKFSTEEIEEVIANGRRLVAEAREALANTDRFCAEHNIDPAECMEYLRKHSGEAAVRAVEAEVQALKLEIDEEVERRRLHGTKQRSAGKRPTTRNMI